MGSTRFWWSHGRTAPSTPRPGLRWSGSRRVLAAVERRQRVTDLAARRLRQQAAVAALGQGALGGGEDLAELAQATCEAAAANLDADFVAVLERGHDGLVPVARAGSPPETLAGELLRWEPPCARVLRDGRAAGGPVHGG